MQRQIQPVFPRDASRLTRLLSFCLIGQLFVMAGCGNKNPKTIQVQGKITYHGKALDQGEVQFSPVGEGKGALRRVAVSELDSQGNYSLGTFTKGDGVLPGEYAVTVTPLKRKSSIDGGDGVGKIPRSIPSSYSQQDSTPLKATILADGPSSVDLNFELKD